MPKKVWNIEKFDGGLNDHSDARDIDNTELSVADNIVVEKVGTIGMTGLSAISTSLTNTPDIVSDGSLADIGFGVNMGDQTVSRAVEVQEGYGLLYFPHDRRNAHLGQHLFFEGERDYTGTGADGDLWDKIEDGDTQVTFGSSQCKVEATGTGADYAIIQQETPNRMYSAISGHNYMLEYEILDSTESANADIKYIQILGGDDYFANNDNHINLWRIKGYHYAIFSSDSNSANLPFGIKIKFKSDNTGEVIFGRLKLKPWNCSSSTDDYMLFVNGDTMPNTRIFSKKSGGWGWGPGIVSNPTSIVTNHTKFSSYQVDGALRFCNANFAHGKWQKPMWLGYIDRNMSLDHTGSSYIYKVNGWEQYPAEIPKPNTTWSYNTSIVEYDNWENADLEYNWNEDDGNYFVKSKTLINSDWVDEGGDSDFGGISYIRVKVKCTPSVDWELIGGIGNAEGYSLKFLYGVASDSVENENFDSDYTQHPKVLEWPITYWSNLFGLDGGAMGDGAAGNSNQALYRYVSLPCWPPNFDTATADWTHLKVKLIPGTPDGGSVDMNIYGTQLWRTPTHLNYSDVLAPETIAGGYNNWNNCNVFIRTDWETHENAQGWVGLEEGNKWQFAAAFEYDGKQIGPLGVAQEAGGYPDGVEDHGTNMPFFQTGSVGEYIPDSAGDGKECPKMEVAFLAHEHSNISKRITGIYIYARNVFASEGAKWYLGWKVDMITNELSNTNTGYSTYMSEKFTTLTDGAFYRSNQLKESTNLYPPSSISYEEHAGMLPEEISTSASWKTAVVVNRRAWIGNLKIHLLTGDTIERPDAMIGSNVNSFDIFPYSSIDELTIGDGDEIVKLETYADRILQFKKNTMYLYNIAELAEEFLEDQYEFKGVEFHYNTVATDFGIAWINKYGVYFYNGESVTNLFEKIIDENINKRIDPDTWDDFIGDLSDCMVGYIPLKQQFFIAGETNYMLYDFGTKSWVRGLSILDTPDNMSDQSGTYVGDKQRTNFVNRWDGVLLWIEKSDGVLAAKKWKPNMISTDDKETVTFATKDLDFGHPGVRKKIYKVYVSYKGDASAVKVKYGINGETDSDDMYQFNSSDTPLAAATTGEEWTIGELKPTTSSEANNIKSVRVHFNGEADYNFQINDISIIYRMKNIK